MNEFECAVEFVLRILFMLGTARKTQVFYRANMSGLGKHTVENQWCADIVGPQQLLFLEPLSGTWAPHISTSQNFTIMSPLKTIPCLHFRTEDIGATKCRDFNAILISLFIPWVYIQNAYELGLLSRNKLFVHLAVK